ncbi:MAG: hypothetical protein HN542_03335 [Flavobacteriales bacterium]|jgi:hypothetical protein|nr:hypothetical protein [Flavobacteriales bacterium]MBT3962679.1 hypothetical protein [Flavobacteriales bacterium]MBT4705044.1 hypothetical protein [Flavobacteriales bacterium]MBT4930063.1 hypothetical protein [Flavobacteriales bacterium]MBT5133021.1 hypothetical protein [Flavobacteriales bacterium]
MKKLIGLICAYEGRHIDRKNNAKEIAKEYGWTEENSGRKICQLYDFYCSPTNRIAIPDEETRTTLKNKIQLFNSAIPHLSPEAKLRALEDIKSLERQYETIYS